MNKRIGNIVTNSSASKYSQLFNVVKTVDEADLSLPTLIIGWSTVKSQYPNARISNKKLTELVHWTFTKMERRCDYEEDIIDFYRYCLNNSMSHIKYTYVDIFTFRMESIKKLISFARSWKEKKTVFFTKGSRFMFVYSEKYSTVFGVSLSTLEYIGIQKKKVTRLLRNAEYINSDFMDYELRQLVGHNTHYILPLREYFR